MMTRMFDDSKVLEYSSTTTGFDNISLSLSLYLCVCVCVLCVEDLSSLLLHGSGFLHELESMSDLDFFSPLPEPSSSGKTISQHDDHPGACMMN